MDQILVDRSGSRNFRPLARDHWSQIVQRVNRVVQDRIKFIFSRMTNTNTKLGILSFTWFLNVRSQFYNIDENVIDQIN